MLPYLTAEFQAFANGFPVAVLDALIGVVIWAGAFFLHARLSSGKPIDQVRDGNGAAAVALGGAMISLALPLGVALTASPSSFEGALWGAAISLVQLLLLRVLDMALRGLPERVREGDVTAAVLLDAARLSVAILLACCVAG